MTASAGDPTEEKRENSCKNACADTRSESIGLIQQHPTSIERTLIRLCAHMDDCINPCGLHARRCVGERLLQLRGMRVHEVDIVQPERQWSSRQIQPIPENRANPPLQLCVHGLR